MYLILLVKKKTIRETRIWMKRTVIRGNEEDAKYQKGKICSFIYFFLI